MSGIQVLRRVRGAAADASVRLAVPRPRPGFTWRLVFAAINVALVTAIAAILLIDLGIAGNPWYRIVGITGGSMAPVINRGDLVLIVPAPAKVEPGMILLMSVGSEVVTHRVTVVNADGSFVTRGDANRANDAWAGRPIRVSGRYLATIPWLGHILPIKAGSDASFADGAGATMHVTVGPFAAGVVAHPTQQPAANANGWNNSDVLVTWNWTDSGAGVEPADCPPTSTSSGEGALILTATCTDRAGVTGSASYALSVDMTAPEVVINDHPADPSGSTAAAFEFTVSDPGGSGIDAVTCALDDGPATPCDTSTSQAYTGLGNGPHTFTIGATDLAGNAAQTAFTWTISTAGPTITLAHLADGSNGWNRTSPVAIVVTIGEGASTIAASPSCTDNGQPLAVSGTAPAYGASVAGDGLHDINCTVTDAAGRHASAVDTVKLDTVKPTVTVPADIEVDASGPSGAMVDYSATFADSTSGLATSVCVPASGAIFPVGASTIICTATDLAGNAATAEFRVTVRPAPPGAPVAAPTQAPPPNGDGWNNTDVVVTWNWSSVDSPIDAARCTTSSTSGGEGMLTLTATCANMTGVTGSASYGVKVDKTGPVVAITSHPPASGGSSSAAFTFSAADAGGSGIGVVTCKLDNGPASPCTTPTSQAYEGLARGSHTFTVIATDLAGNNSQATFTWCITSGQGPSISVKHAVDGSSGWNRTSPVVLVITVSPGSAPVKAPPTCTDNNRPLAVAGSAPAYGAAVSGEGAHTIRCKVTDSAGLSANGTDAIQLDSVPPTVTVPASLAVETMEPDGVIVVYAATVADATSGVATKGCAPASGSVFPAAVTTVTCSATDKAGNTRAATFTVTVTVQTANQAKLAVLVDLQAELATATSKDLKKRLSDAIRRIEDSLVVSLWVASGPHADGNHLDPVNGAMVFDAERAAVEALIGIKKPSPTIRAVIAKLAAVDEFLARTAINDVVAGSVDPALVAAARLEMSAARGDLTRGHPDLAIGHWKVAWRLVTPTFTASAFAYV